MRTFISNPSEFWSETLEAPKTLAQADRMFIITPEIIRYRFAGMRAEDALEFAATGCKMNVVRESIAASNESKFIARSNLRKWESVYEYISNNYSPEDIIA